MGIHLSGKNHLYDIDVKKRIHGPSQAGFVIERFILILMTPHEALAEGRLVDAIAMQEAVVNAAPFDLAARRFLIDLLAFAGRFVEAQAHLRNVSCDEEEWAGMARNIELLFQAEGLRLLAQRPRINPEPAPGHAELRWQAILASRVSDPESAIHSIDAADSASTEVWGFIDGQEFESLRDADDCFASVLEAYRDGEYHWFAWEAVRKLELAPAEVLLDQLYRPATLTLKDHSTFDVHLPLVYPGSYEVDEPFALGTFTDHICPDGGPTRCTGGKLLLVGDDAEIPLRECRMIELR